VKVELLRNMQISKRFYHRGVYVGKAAEVFIPELEAGSQFVVELEPYAPPAEVGPINHDLSKSGETIPGFSKVATPEVPAKTRDSASRKKTTKKTTRKRTPRKS